MEQIRREIPGAEIDRMLQVGVDFTEIDDPKASLGDVLSVFKSRHGLNDLRFISSPRFEADGVVDPSGVGHLFLSDARTLFGPFGSTRML